jgi:hypothetical protein
LNKFKELNIYDYLFPWPAVSPDMNPIEHIWQLMKGRIHRRVPRPVKRPTLIIAIQEEWDRITPEEVNELISSMPECIEVLRAAGGGHTRF